MYDILIIGAGVIGTGIARELSKYNLKVAILEKDTDVANETTKANSAIVHGGYDAKEGSLMAKLNVLGNSLYEDLCNELSVPFKRNGSLVLAFNDEEVEHLKVLYNRGIINKVPGLNIIDAKKLKEIEPNIDEKAIAALHCSSAGIVSPWELAEALIDNAVENGVDLFLNTEVKNIEKIDDTFYVTTNSGIFHGKHIFNCAGVFADIIHNMIAPKTYTILPRKGEYFVLDKNQGKRVNQTVFQCPSKLGKGILVTPTVHGNLLVGPDAQDINDRYDVSTATDRLDYIKFKGSHSIKDINFRENIRTFAGIRAESDRGDFIVEESSVKGFYDIAGIKSPGLSAAPAIALAALDLLKENGINLNKKEDFKSPRKHTLFMHLSSEEKAKKIEEDNRFGRIICRCEMITEGEIVEAIHRPVKATTMDAVKRRCRPGSGRCQGGFCGPRVQEIIARELNEDIKDVILDKANSYILIEELKK
ncbi:NAD(P)/FAD-dependent oxidoreductase [Candidatus Cetobacterium colombiensis]|uniref:NAD(P)/FAD-dependent oxidoreductase n=1 Tax=Candidatus Cetobacterium colombiensis TaxID=3073100 RepID=A0ABU4WB78_9FUSO|nr:NAD(P)/FAD-dependent oxidoreductase [Candidatus Cetobacterium colombiensis]MDX8336410.1 NAD(P)/FAD-dependent oxidoreductase [Candidatus Cetobacterium colombiensis]